MFNDELVRPGTILRFKFGTFKYRKHTHDIKSDTTTLHAIDARGKHRELDIRDIVAIVHPKKSRSKKC